MSRVAHPYAKAIRTTLIVTAASVLAMVVGFVLAAMGNKDAGFVFVIVGMPLLLCCLFLLLILWATGLGMRRQIQKLVDGDFLAHWTYSGMEWRSYTEAEWERARPKAKGMPLKVIGIMLIVGAFMHFMREEMGLVQGILFGGAIGVPLGLLVGGLAYWLAWSTHRKRLETPGEVFIGATGFYQDGTFTGWTGYYGRLLGVTMASGEPAALVFKIEGHRRSVFDVRVAIPKGKEEEAERIMAQLSPAPSGGDDAKLEAWLADVMGRLQPDQIKFGEGEKLVDVFQRTLKEEEERVGAGETDPKLRAQKMKLLEQLRKKFS